MKLLHLVLFSLGIGLGLQANGQNLRPVGTNLSGIVDYSSEFVFVDAFKQSREWITHDIGPGAPWSSNVNVPLGPNGYPLEVPYDDGTNPPQGLRSLLFFGDLNGIYPAGSYRLRVMGTGVINLEVGTVGTFNCPVDTVVTVSNTAGGVFIDIVQSSVADPISEINFVMPGFHSTYTAEPFHPKFLDFIEDFQVIRFMDWLSTNNSDNSDWSDRNSPTYYTQTLENGVAPEILIDLCNRELKNPWICIPHEATNDYIMQMADLLKNTLDTSLTIHVEYSNEVWNTLFAQSQYNTNMGAFLGYTGAPWEVGWKYYAKRTADVFHIFDSVFVGSDRISKVVASQAANPWLSNEILTFFNDPIYNPNQVTADALAVAPYFGAVADVFGDAGLATSCTVSQILDSMEATLPQTYQWMQDTKTVADNHNLDFVAYEGGQHLVAGPTYHNDVNFVAKLIDANRDPRMTDLYCQYFNYWYDSVTPSLFCNFSSLYIPSKYGAWGLKEYFDDTLAPKYVGMKDCVFPYNTSIANVEEMKVVDNKIVIYPNPTNASVSILFSEEVAELNLLIFDAVGQIIHSGLISSNGKIDLERFSSGIYYFEFSDENKISVFRKKVIKN